MTMAMTLQVLDMVLLQVLAQALHNRSLSSVTALKNIRYLSAQFS
jgi:hypothetical protein